jgi:hypothetical protein
MQKLLDASPFLFSALWGSILLLPLAALEIINRWKFQEGFPVAVFTFTWILQTLFIYILIPLVKRIRSRSFLKQNLLFTILNISGLVLIASIWFGWVSDQWPCLMGVPNCD